MEELSEFLMDFGERLLLSGAEISRVEDSIGRLCTAYGAHAEVFALTNAIYLTVTKDKKSQTTLRRINHYQTDLNYLDKLNDTCRKICVGSPPISEARKWMEEIESKRYNTGIQSVVYAFVAASFSLFFGGGVRDAAISAAIGVVLYFLDQCFAKRQLNRIFSVFVVSVLCGLIAAGAIRIGWGRKLSSILIGDIMLLVPGLAITNSVRDMMKGDMLSGILRLLESILIAIFMTIGFAIPQMLLGIF